MVLLVNILVIQFQFMKIIFSLELLQFHLQMIQIKDQHIFFILMELHGYNKTHLPVEILVMVLVGQFQFMEIIPLLVLLFLQLEVIQMKEQHIFFILMVAHGINNNN